MGSVLLVLVAVRDTGNMILGTAMALIIEGSCCSVAAIQLITLVRVAPVGRLGGNYYIIMHK